MGQRLFAPLARGIDPSAREGKSVTDYRSHLLHHLSEVYGPHSSMHLGSGRWQFLLQALAIGRLHARLTDGSHGLGVQKMLIICE